ncbi:hypothetical protein RU639_001618 [Aspergillus parasiticus]
MASNYAIIKWRDLNLETAYQWKKDKIYNYINRVADNPASFANGNKQDAANLQSRQPTLDRVRNCILNLSRGSITNNGETQDGPDYTAPGTPQHIRRQENPAYTPPLEVSEYLVNSHKLPRFPDFLSEVFQFSSFYWNPADLLGLFFALLGPAPAGANAVRFFLPLTAMYGRWCLEIMNLGGKPKKGLKKPFMVNCTWTQRRGDYQPVELFLGASLGGYAGGHESAWHMEIMLRRYELVWLFMRTRKINNTGAMFEAMELGKLFRLLRGLLSYLPLDQGGPISDANPLVQRIQRETKAKAMKLKDFPFSYKGELPGINQDSLKENASALLAVYDKQSTKSLLERLKECQTVLPPLIKAANHVATNPETRFGNCAETYPFMNILRDKLGRMAFEDHSWGLALQTSALSGGTYDDGTSSKIFKNLRPPCANCRYMLKRLGHNEDSINANFGEDSIKNDLILKQRERDAKQREAEGTAGSSASTAAVH